jgi:hypothetical protein
MSKPTANEDDPTNLTAPRDPWPDNLAAMRRALIHSGQERQGRRREVE